MAQAEITKEQAMARVKEFNTLVVNHPEMLAKAATVTHEDVLKIGVFIARGDWKRLHSHIGYIESKFLEALEAEP